MKHIHLCSLILRPTLPPLCHHLQYVKREGLGFIEYLNMVTWSHGKKILRLYSYLSLEKDSLFLELERTADQFEGRESMVKDGLDV